MHALAIGKDSGDRYVFLFDRGSFKETLKQFGRFAIDPELDFTWYDAAILARKVQTLTKPENV